MSAIKRPSTSSLRRFITSRPFVTVAELRRRFGLDDPDAMTRLAHNGTVAWIGLPEREAAKLQELWDRNELGVELSVEVRAPVVVGVYPMRIARYVMDGGTVGNGSGNGQSSGNGRPVTGASFRSGSNGGDGHAVQQSQPRADSSSMSAPRPHPHAPRPMSGAPTYGSPDARPGTSGAQPRG